MTTSWTPIVTASNALGESPFWHPDEGRLYWVDIGARQILRWHAETDALDCWDLPHDPGCIAPARGGGLVVALRDGVYRARHWQGAMQRIATFDYDQATMRFNDGKCDPLGRFWAGTRDEVKAGRRAALFSIDARDGGTPQVRLQVGDANTANGLAWSPDGATLYWADTSDHRVRAWDWDAAGNVLSRERVFHAFAPKPSGWQPGLPDNGGYRGRPDGAAVDVQGNYYVAMYEGGRICQFAADGRWLADIDVPAMCPTMPCFGGPDRKTLFVTTASQKRPPDELDALPLSGCVLQMQVEVPGLPVNWFEDGRGGTAADT